MGAPTLTKIKQALTPSHGLPGYYSIPGFYSINVILRI
jgi:hypothetical protein